MDMTCFPRGVIKAAFTITTHVVLPMIPYALWLGRIVALGVFASIPPKGMVVVAVVAAVQFCSMIEKKNN